MLLYFHYDYDIVNTQRRLLCFIDIEDQYLSECHYLFSEKFDYLYRKPVLSVKMSSNDSYLYEIVWILKSQIIKHSKF